MTKNDKNGMIEQLIMQENNEEQVYLWASAFLGSLSIKRVKEIYDREFQILPKP